MVAGASTTHVAMPRVKRGMKLQFSIDEDEWTLAWDALRKARLPLGAIVAAHGFEKAIPEWFWAGLNLAPSQEGAYHVRFVPTTVGPSVAVHPAGPAPDVEEEAKRLYEAAATRREDVWQRHRNARDMPDAEADYPLGAYVTQPRHDAVTTGRMRLAQGTVATWTTIGPGAAPTEFTRLQDAVGAYHAVMVDVPGHGRTVGIWGDEAPPKTGDKAEPALRRLFKTQGAWRHGVVFVRG